MAAGLVGCGASEDPDDETPARACPTTLYLSFDGGALSRGAEDATRDIAAWLPEAAVTVPAYLAGEPDREARIDAIVTQVQTILAPFDVDVVTERPAEGPYDMIVFGGDSASFGLPPGLAAIHSSECDADRVAANVAAVFDGGWEDVAAANYAIEFLGVAHGIATTTTPGDCMCQTCPDRSTACELSPAATVADTYRDTCGGPGTQDTAAAFAARLTCP